MELAEDDDDNIAYIYVLAPITGLVAIGVITYIAIQSRKLRKQMFESGQLVNMVPAVISYNNQGQSVNILSHENIRSPDGMPPPPPYSKY